MKKGAFLSAPATNSSNKVFICLSNFIIKKSISLRLVIVLFFSILIHSSLLGQASASYNYDMQTGALGVSYNWVDCTSGTTVISGDDNRGSIAWPFGFAFYDNIYT